MTVIEENDGDGPILETISQPRLPDLIAQQIMAAIRGGSLNAGDRLPTEAELARQFGVGRTSVREGLQKLQTLGVVEVVKGRGARVREPRLEDAMAAFREWSAARTFAIEEHIEVRMALEGLAAGLAAVRASDADIAALEENNSAHREADERHDLFGVVEADERFHDVVIRAAGSQLLARIYEMLIPEVLEFRARTHGLRDASARSVQGHERIIATIRGGDASGAKRR